LWPKFSQNLKLFNFLNAEEKIWTSFQIVLELFTQKFALSFKQYGVGIRDPEKTSSGSQIRVQGSKRHRIPDPQHCNIQRSVSCFPQKIALKHMGLGSRIRDPESGKNLFRIQDPGIKMHRIPDPDPQNCKDNAK
jgi:hypothetical protein